MPTYDYECAHCGHVFEMVQSITAKPKKLPPEPCAGCGRRAPIRRLIGSGGAVLFKGSGFYETDYRSESYKKAAKADKQQADGGSQKSSDKGASTTDSSSSASSSESLSSKSGASSKAVA